MKSKFSLSAAVVVAAGLALAGCSSGAEDHAGMDHAAPAAQADADGHTDPSMASMIHIQDGKFIDPKPLEAGSEVTVMNMGDTAATVVSDEAGKFSVTVQAGGITVFTAPDTPGSYPYHSAAGDMQGVLTVLGDTASEAATDTAPGAAPEAATMVCEDQAKNAVKDILALPALPEPVSEWDGTTYTCTYPLEVGDFMMSVVVSDTPEKANMTAQKLAASLNAPSIEGLANLGLPGYQSQAGDVVFAKDDMTLHVDATALPAALGEYQVSPSDFAYQMSTTILGCWTAHHS